MARIITIDPVSRISGFLEINAEVEEHIVTNATADGLLFRGFEMMLRGRQPLDAIYFTERICGICSAAHAYASTLALEDSLHIVPSKNDKYLREIIHGFEYIQNHLRHFYLMIFPSFVKISNPSVASVNRYTDYRIPEDWNAVLEEHYRQAIEFAMLAHEGQSVLGAKAPHHHGIFAGGVTADLTAYKIEKIKAIAGRLLAFVASAMREDAEVLSYYYPDYYEMGISYPNFLSYGAFDNEEESISYVKPGVLINGVSYPLQPELITEQVNYSWLVQDDSTTNVDISKKDAYTFVKAPRYNHLPMEVGPLARMLISGNYKKGHSCMDRIYARMLETEKILNIINNLTNLLELSPNGQREIIFPDTTKGAGLIDTTRGALGHFVNIKNKVIEHYSIITPSNWNLSPRDTENNPGTVEKSMIGTTIQDLEDPVELGRIVRSFDPCVSCATHLITKNGKESTVEINV